MVIVGSRGLTKLKGMLLGSVSYYLVQKSSVPVMVARRRLQSQVKQRKSMSQLDRHARVPLSHAETEMESHAAEVHSSDSEEDVDDDTGVLSDKASEKLPSRPTTDDEASESESDEEEAENEATLLNERTPSPPGQVEISGGVEEEDGAVETEQHGDSKPQQQQQQQQQST